MTSAPINYLELTEKIKSWAQELGFADIGIADIDMSIHQVAFDQWLEKQYHGDMTYMKNNREMRFSPNELVPNTVRVLSARMDYLPTDAKFAATLKNKDKAYISRYALGRDYHKLMRKRLKQLGEKIKQYCGQFNYRPFVDSAPVLERPFAEKAGLGWSGKHTLVINEKAGSWFFLGELFIDIPLPISTPVSNQCGNCVACIKICPTQAIVAPYQLDARRCISYLTIEHRGSIPLEFRSLIGNRIYGCDDCQLICPWNQYAQLSGEADFQARNHLDEINLLTLFHWDEATFLHKMEGSPIRRIGFECWQRNIAVALGNCDYSIDVVNALNQQLLEASDLVKEHIEWAIDQHQNKGSQLFSDANQRLTARLIRSVEKGLPRDA